MRLAALATYFGMDGWALLAETDPAERAIRAQLVQEVAALHEERAKAEAQAMRAARRRRG